jgi:hypothetical protein
MPMQHPGHWLSGKRSASAQLPDSHATPHAMLAATTPVAQRSPQAKSDPTHPHERPAHSRQAASHLTQGPFQCSNTAACLAPPSCRAPQRIQVTKTPTIMATNPGGAGGRCAGHQVSILRKGNPVRKPRSCSDALPALTAWPRSARHHCVSLGATPRCARLGAPARARGQRARLASRPGPLGQRDPPVRPPGSGRQRVLQQAGHERAPARRDAVAAGQVEHGHGRHARQHVHALVRHLRAPARRQLSHSGSSLAPRRLPGVLRRRARPRGRRARARPGDEKAGSPAAGRHAGSPRGQQEALTRPDGWGAGGAAARTPARVPTRMQLRAAHSVTACLSRSWLHRSPPQQEIDKTLCSYRRCRPGQHAALQGPAATHPARTLFLLSRRAAGRGAGRRACQQ